MIRWFGQRLTGYEGYDHGLKPTIPDPELRGIAYFVVSGAIEPRKNHLLLLNVWRELVRADTPSLDFHPLLLAGLPAHIGFVS